MICKSEQDDSQAGPIQLLSAIVDDYIKVDSSEVRLSFCTYLRTQHELAARQTSWYTLPDSGKEKSKEMPG